MLWSSDIIYLFIYLFIYLSIYLFIYLSIYLFIYLFIYLLQNIAIRERRNLYKTRQS